MGSRKRDTSRSKRAPALVPPSTTRKPLLIDGTDQQFREFIDDFVQLSGRLQALRQALARAMGMTAPQYNILMILARAEVSAGMSMSALARRLAVSLSFVVSETQTLERMGLVGLRRNPADRRSVLAAVTRRGRTRIIRAATRIQRVNDRLFASLTRAELKTIDGVIKRTIKGSEAAALALKGK